MSLADPTSREAMLVRKILDSKVDPDLVGLALQGFVMRVHVEEAHPDDLELVAALTLAKLPAEHHAAWLLGYRHS